jgi:hypothetical protein
VGDVRREDILAWNPVEAEVAAHPHPAHVRNHRVFRSLYGRTKDLMREIATP